MTLGLRFCLTHAVPSPHTPPHNTGAISYGLASILLLTPLVGLLLVQLALPLQPPALVLGLGVFCAMPTALSSGITFTQVGWLGG